jgi:ribosomal protein S18 acetylase RimI-like enzyme
MDPEVRPATPDDIEALVRLQAMARESLTDVRGGQVRLRECQPVTDWAGMLADPAVLVLVASLLEVVLGYMVMVLRPDIDRGVITHAFVEEGAREHGLGDTMVEHAIDSVRGAGLAAIEAVALPGDRETKNLYERAGLTARKITVYKSLTPPVPSAEHRV